MKLSEVIDQVKAIEGYQYHRLRATDHKGMVKCYTFWFEKGSKMRDYEVRILVINEGKPEEVAQAYSTEHIQPETAFREAMNTAIEQYQSTHPELEHYEITSVNERGKTGRVTAYIYNETEDILIAEQHLLWDEAGTIKRRKVELTPEIV